MSYMEGSLLRFGLLNSLPIHTVRNEPTRRGSEKVAIKREERKSHFSFPSVSNLAAQRQRTVYSLRKNGLFDLKERLIPIERTAYSNRENGSKSEGQQFFCAKRMFFA